MFSVKGIVSGLTNRKNTLLIAAALVAGFILIKKVIQ